MLLALCPRTRLSTPTGDNRGILCPGMADAGVMRCGESPSNRVGGGLDRTRHRWEGVPDRNVALTPRQVRGGGCGYSGSGLKVYAPCVSVITHTPAHGTG